MECPAFLHLTNQHFVTVFFSEMINHDAPHYQACMYQAPINDTSKAQA